MRQLRAALVAAILAIAPAHAAPPADPFATILPLKERAVGQDAVTRDRLDRLVGALMREHAVDLWLILAREDAEDPVALTMLDARSMSARRQTILLFHDPGGGRPVERLTVSRYGVAGLFAPAWDPAKQPDQWARLAELVAERDPKRIAVDVDLIDAHADGLTHSQRERLMAALPLRFRERVVPAGPLAVGWLETRTEAEVGHLRTAARIGHALIEKAFSREVVTPGRTTAEDVEWWFREQIAGLTLGTWFHPSVSIFRRGAPAPLSGAETIQPGDMLWCDLGITYMRMNSDQQELAYVLRPHETDAPVGLKAGLAAANRLQEMLTAAFRAGRSGNEMLAAARETALAANLQPSFYSHPIGFHGHAAGAAIGFWDDQRPSPKGEHRLRPMTAWSIELAAKHAVPEWDGQVIEFRQEQDALFTGTGVDWLDGRQTRLHLIGVR